MSQLHGVVRGPPTLFDLGYYGFSLFERINRNGGFFLSRLKSTGNPTIVSLNRVHRGRKAALVGEKTGKRFALGDRLRVRIAEVDPPQGKVDLRIAGGGNSGKGNKRRQGRRRRD